VQKQAFEYENLLLDEKGNKRPLKDYQALVKAVHNKYNNIWLRTEYNTVLNTGFTARKYIEAQRDKEVLPYFQYKTAHDERVRNSHKLLDGVVKPVDDPFWDTYLPPNGYNCRCTVIRLEKATVTPDTKILLPDVPLEFRKNPVKTGQIFSDNHNYFKFIDKKRIDYLANKRFNFRKYLSNLDTYLSLIKKDNILPPDKSPVKAGFNRQTGSVVLFEKGDDFKKESEMPFVKFANKNGDVIIFRSKPNPETPHIDTLYNGELTELKDVKNNYNNNYKKLKNKIKYNIRKANKKGRKLNEKVNVFINLPGKYKKRSKTVKYIYLGINAANNDNQLEYIKNIFVLVNGKQINIHIKK
jgi:SPP1 gp7 family putative phage head morphogenesis protein